MQAAPLRTVELGSDPELVARMARGDSQALAALYERHAPTLCALARHILGQEAEAEDLLHDVFLEVWRHAADYSEQRGSVRAWLAIRTRSRALDRRRSAPMKLRVELTDAHFESLGASLDADTQLSPDAERVRAALRRMSEEEQKVVWLGYFEGLTSSQIAERFGIPVGTVKSRTRSAIMKLRAWLGPEKDVP